MIYALHRAPVKLHTALRDYEPGRLRELFELGKGKNVKTRRRACPDDLDNDVAGLLCSLDRPKHLLLIYPQCFHLGGVDKVPRNAVNCGLHHEYGNAIALQRELRPGKETYIAYFREKRFVICEATDEGLRVFDDVPLVESEAFMSIVGHNSALEHGPIDELVSRN